MPKFTQAINRGNFILAHPHHVGSGIIELVSTFPLPSDIPGTERNLRFVATRKSDGARVILLATGRSGNQFTGVTAIENTTDIELAVEDSITTAVTAGYLNDAYDAIKTVQTALADITGSSEISNFFVDQFYELDSTETQATGTDVKQWSTVVRDATPLKVYLTSKIAPTGSNFIIDILTSVDSGATWVSLWAGATQDRPTLSVGQRQSVATTFSTDSIAEGSLIRVDIIQIGSNVSGINLAIQLVLQMDSLLLFNNG